MKVHRMVSGAVHVCRWLNGLRFAVLSLLLMIGQGTLPQEAQAAENNTDLAKQTQNPVADLISLPFQNNTSFGIGPNNRMQNVLNIQPVVPFSCDSP